MSGRYWMRNTALGGCLIFAVLVVLTDVASSQSPEGVSEQGQSIDEGPQAPVVPSGLQKSTTDQSQIPQAEENQAGNNTGKQKPANEAAEEPVGASPAIAPAKPISDKLEGNTQPKESDNSKEPLFQWNDTVAQWIMAIFGAMAVGISVWAVWLLRQTLIATRDAVDQAAEGTKAAQISVKHSEKAAAAAMKQADLQENAFRRLERPYLFIKILSTDHLRNPGRDFVARINYTLVNHGKTPAILRSISIGLLDDPKFPLLTTGGIDEERYEVIGPGDALNVELCARVISGEKGQGYNGAIANNLFLYGLIDYDDPTGAHHHDSILMRGIAGGKDFKIEGGAEYNWNRTERPSEINRET